MLYWLCYCTTTLMVRTRFGCVRMYPTANVRLICEKADTDSGNHSRGSRTLRRTFFVTICILFAILTTTPILGFPARAFGLSSSSLTGFGLAASPDSTSLGVGTGTSVTIIVSSQGLNGPVSLAAAAPSSSGLTFTLSPSTAIVLPGGNANSTLSMDATSAQPGTYNVQVTGSSPLTPSQEITVVTDVTTTASSPPVNPPSGSAPPSGTSPPSGSGSSGNSGSGNTQTSTTTSSPSTRGSTGPRGESPSSTPDPIGFLIAGNLLATIAVAAALGSLRRRKQTSLSSWQ